MASIEDLLGTVASEIETTVTKKTDDKIKNFEEFVNNKVTEVEELVKTGAKLEVTTDTTKNTLFGLKHKNLEQLITMAGQRIPVLLVGMAGTGKTHAGEQVAQALGLSFYAMSVGAQTSKSDIIGYQNANGVYVPTLFRKAFEEGGVFLMDEIDAGNANVLIQVNAALSNGYCAFPDKMVKKHENFIFIASANTYGLGANRLYVGRNQLDAATLDRFAVLDWDVDTSLEKALAGKEPDGLKWFKLVQAVREEVMAQGLRSLITPRATIKGTKLLKSGISYEDVLQAVILCSVPQDKQAHIKEVASKVWG